MLSNSFSTSSAQRMWSNEATYNELCRVVTIVIIDARVETCARELRVGQRETEQSWESSVGISIVFSY